MTSLVTLSDPGSVEAEAYRGLRTNLRVAAGEAGALVITSAAPGEGKSEVAGNLAVVCAEAGQRVVLVDGDLRRPRQHEQFALANDRGVSTVLGGDAVGQLPLQASPVAGLELLAAGPAADRPADLLSSPLMAELVAALKDRADLVLVEAPPLLVASDAAAVAAVADAVVLVLAAGQSRRADAVLAREALDRVGADLLGVVLTGVSSREAGYGYFEREAGPQ